MGRPLFVLLLMLAALVQATLLPALGLVVLPNAVLVLVLVRGATRGVAGALAWAAVAGVLLDVLAMDRIGVNALALLPVALIGGLGRRRLFQSGVLFPMLLAVVATFAHALVLSMLRGSGREALDAFPAIARLVVLQGLLNAVLVPPLYGLVGWMTRPEPEGR